MLFQHFVFPLLSKETGIYMTKLLNEIAEVCDTWNWGLNLLIFNTYRRQEVTMYTSDRWAAGSGKPLLMLP